MLGEYFKWVKNSKNKVIDIEREFGIMIDGVLVKGKIDRLRKHLLDNQVNTDKNWSALIVNEITYNVEDEENEDETNLHIAEFEITITHFNHFT